MMKQFSQSLISLIALIIMLGKPMCSYAAEISVDTYNHSGPFSIRVIFKDGKYDWAQNILVEAPRYIRMVERYLGIPFAFGNHLTIEGCDNCTSRAEIAQRKIYLDQSCDPLNNPALLFHEINHFWFYYYVNPSNEEWLIEGISSFLPVVMRDLHLLPDEHKYNRAIDQWWGLESLLPKNTKDLPLYPFRESKRQIVYLKSYRVQFIINCLLGEKRYRSFLKKIASIKRRQPIVVLRLLNSYKKANWRRILSGWVFRGSYRRVALNDFISDEDFDGLSKAKEICIKSSPVDYDTDQDLLPDGAEIELGRNPRRMDPDGLELLQQHGPFVDGNDKEWEYLSAVSSNDEVGEVQGPQWADMLNTSAIIQNEVLYVLIRNSLMPEKSSSVFFTLLIDSNNDNETEMEFGFFLSSPNYPWHYTYSSESAVFPIHLRAASGAFIEMAIPIDLISSSSIRILPVLRNDVEKRSYDWWESWINISA